MTRQLGILPTGCGKTPIFATLPTFFGFTRKILVLAHREELIDQAIEKCRLWTTLRVGKEMADNECDYLRDEVIVASVPTLGRVGSLRLSKFKPRDFDCLIVDEAHHSTAQSYRTIFEHFGVLEPDNRPLLWGTTATPNRADGQGLGQIFDEIVYQMTILNAIQQGWLTDVRGIQVRTDVGLDDVHTVEGDFQINELAAKVNTCKRNYLIVREWMPELPT